MISLRSGKKIFISGGGEMLDHFNVNVARDTRATTINLWFPIVTQTLRNVLFM